MPYLVPMAEGVFSTLSIYVPGLIFYPPWQLAPLNQSPQRHSYNSGFFGSLSQYPPLRQGSLSQAVSCTVGKIQKK